MPRSVLKPILTVGGMAQVIEHLPQKFETLSSKPQYCKKKKKTHPETLPQENSEVYSPKKNMK
jgi:uncharacterized protein (DUF4213/DUF364 family)